MIQIEKVSSDIAERLCRQITADLPEYFGLPEVNEHYAIGVRFRQNLAAKIEDDYVGLISIDFPYPHNGDIYWMAVLRCYQAQGVGRQLIQAACRLAKHKGALTMTVETLAPGHADENYLKTYQFYQANEFYPLFDLQPKGYEWKMVYMIKSLEKIGSN